MTSIFRSSARHAGRAVRPLARIDRQTRRDAATAPVQKREGDISDAFASLSGAAFGPLEPRFARLKALLTAGREEALHDSWNRLLASLREEIALIAERGSKIIPEIDFGEIDTASAEFRAEIKKRGVAVVRNVVPEQEALAWKQSVRDYIAANPQTKAFPAHDPQVFELYWSAAQMSARTHPNLLRAQRFLMEFWHSAKDPGALVSPSHPTIYSDRLRMRQPGDGSFALGPHVDGGSCERWEADGYGTGNVYEAIWRGEWEKYDAWEASCRLPVVSDKYGGVGACSMFRMLQGWMSLSETGPGEGTLLVNPLLGRATAYFLLRPFFAPKQPAEADSDTFLAAENWSLQLEPDSWLHGAAPGRGQELRPALHPHLELGRSMVHVPRVRPGDYVAWHCDAIHAVDPVHAGTSDSSVLYIPACPLTPGNAEFLARQRDAFISGVPCPDFGGGIGEAEHIGKLSVEDVRKGSSVEGLRAFGLEEWDAEEPGLTPGQREVMLRANKVLGFYT